MNSKQRQRLLKQRKRRSVGAQSKAVHASSAEYYQALELHRAGDLATAKQLYCQALAKNPNQADCWHMLGMLLVQSGQSAQAIDCLTKALQLCPANGEILANLGAVHIGTQQWSQARECLTKALEHDPGNPNALNNLGVVMLEVKEPILAEVQFRNALQHQPDHADATGNLGNALQHQGRFVEAVPCYRQAVSRDPKNAVLWNNLGSSCKKSKQLEQACDAFQKATRLKPDFEEAQLNLGTTLVEMGRIDEAIEHFDRLVKQMPQSARVHHYRGEAYREAEQFDIAISSYRRARQLDPDYAYSYIGLSTIHQQRGELELAIANLRKAVERQPDSSATHDMLLFAMSADPRISSRELFHEHLVWGRKFGNVQHVFKHSPGQNESQKILRIGYVSPDFRKHAVTAYFEPVLVEHAQGPLEVYLYSETTDADAMTGHLQGLATQWRSTWGMSDLQVAEMIRDDKIDVLIDLAGHTGGNRLGAFAHKPAPVQVTWLGYPNTTGLEAMDYRITTEMQDPIDDETPHVEELVRLSSADVIRPPADAPDVVAPPVQKNGYVTFGSLHRYQKISAEAFDVWANVLHANPTSRLLAFNTTFVGEVKKHVGDQLRRRGIKDERFEIRHETSASNYLHVYNEIDIALDVFPWNGGTTTREALWMGVAVVGLYGDRRSARGTAIALHTAGLDELISYSPEQYVQIASTLAQNPAQLDVLRSSMRRRMEQSLCNAKKFTQELESTYVDLWRRWNRQSPTSSEIQHRA